MPDRRTRTGVEIARVGFANLSTGPFQFTKERLASAVAKAATSVQPARLGIGHVDPRFNQPGNDGDPAFGKAINLRLVEDGDAIVADYDGMIPWLDDNLDTLYPGRSIEARVNGDEMEITAVKLLGTTKPGISTLKDLEQLVAASVATGETSQQQATVAISTLWASTNLDDLREAFYAERPDTGEKDWWSVQEIQINPNQLIVEHHGTDQTVYRVAWSVDTDGNFTFGDLTEVAVQYVDVAASSGEHAVVYKAPVIRPTPIPPEEGPMDPKNLREQLGLAEDASDEDVTAKLTELNARPDEAAVTEQVAAAAQQAKDEAIAASAASAPTAEHLAALQADAAAGREARDLLASQDRETFIAAAMGDGKFPPAAKDSYLAQLAKGGDVEKATREFIDGLPKNTVPVEEIGASGGTDGGDQIASTGWFPQLATQEA